MCNVQKFNASHINTINDNAYVCELLQREIHESADRDC